MNNLPHKQTIYVDIISALDRLTGNVLIKGNLNMNSQLFIIIQPLSTHQFSTVSETQKPFPPHMRIQCPWQPLISLSTPNEFCSWNMNAIIEMRSAAVANIFPFRIWYLIFIWNVIIFLLSKKLTLSPFNLLCKKFLPIFNIDCALKVINWL